MDVLLGYVLLSGVSLSMALIVLGLGWHYFRSGHLWLDDRIAGMNLFQFLVQQAHTVATKTFRPRTLVDLGIVVLMFTPYVRVVASMFYFMFAEKDWQIFAFYGHCPGGSDVQLVSSLNELLWSR